MTGVSRNLSTSAKADDLVELASDLGARHAEDGAVEIDVLAARQLGMKAGADLEQACDAALDRHLALGRLGDARQNLQKRGLAGAIAADDADHLAALDLKAHVLERPEFLGRVAGDDGAAARHVERLAPGISRRAREHVAQRDIAFALGFVADDVFLAEPLGADDDVARPFRSDPRKLRSVRRK